MITTKMTVVTNNEKFTETEIVSVTSPGDLDMEEDVAAHQAAVAAVVAQVARAVQINLERMLDSIEDEKKKTEVPASAETAPEPVEERK